MSKISMIRLDIPLQIEGDFSHQYLYNQLPRLTCVNTLEKGTYVLSALGSLRSQLVL